MADQSPKWIVKDSEGRIYGPFVTQKILRQIEKGYFSGGETISKYPGGTWIPISKAPEFYDKLLDVLAGEAKVKRDSDGSAFAAGAPAPPPLDEQRPRGRVVKESDDSVSPDLQAESTPKGSTGEVDRIDQVAPDESVIELTDLKNLKREEIWKNSKLPFFLILSSVLLVALALIFRPDEKPQNLRLLSPRKGQPEISEAALKERLRLGIQAFQGDTLQGYLRAQTEFVHALEGAPKSTEAAAALCMAYREIWPFASQDSEDMRTFSRVVQEAKRVDPAGFHGATCEILYLMSVNRYREARGLTDMWIQMQSSAPILYDVTADLLRGDRKWIETAGYAEKARVLWPKWLKSYVMEARARTQMRQYQQAMQLYRAVLTANPRHHVARIELGLLEMEQFQQSDKAYDMIKVALDAGEHLPRETEFAASLAMAKILERRNSKRQALEFARRAFSLDPNDPDVRHILLRLGGAEAISDGTRGSREIMSRGDELFRLGDCVGAQAEFRAAFEADKENGVAAMKAGKCFWLLNQSEEAIDWLKKAIFADPNLIPAYVLLADYYGQRFDYLSAARTLQKAQKLVPRSFEVWRGFALVELRRNNFQGAVNFAKRALDIYEADTETYVIMARAHVGLGRFTDAQSFAQRAIELDSSNVEAQSLYASILVSIQGIDAALVYVDSLINSYSQIVDYRVTKGELLVKEERYADAIVTLREARSLDKANKKILLLLGRALHAQGQNVDALQTYLEAAEMDPSDAVPIFMTGLLYAEDNRTLKDAVLQFQRVLKINPRYPLAHVQLGHAYLRQNMGVEALQEAQMERSINPDLADAAILAAEAHYLLKQYSNCANEYQKAVARRASDTSIYVKMARCYRLSGALDSAVSLLNQAKAKESGNPDIYKELGATFHTRAMANEALEAYAQYLALAPNAPDRGEIEAVIRKIQSGDLAVDAKGQ